MKYSAYAIMLFSISLYLLPVTQAAEPRDRTEEAQTSPSTVNLTGMVTEIQGNVCVIKDSYGIKWEFLIDKFTDKIGDVLPGSMVTAEVETNGHAKIVKVLGS